MGFCDNLISQGIVRDCNNLYTHGLESNGVIMNFADLDIPKTTYDKDRYNVVTALGLKTGKKGYPIYMGGATPYEGTGTASSDSTEYFTNTVKFLIPDNSPDMCANIIDKIASGKFVIVLENTFKNINKDENAGDSSYQIYGLKQGLRKSDIQFQQWGDVSGWEITLTETNTPYSGIFYYDTDLATTEAKIKSLTAA